MVSQAKKLDKVGIQPVVNEPFEGPLFGHYGGNRSIDVTEAKYEATN